MKRRRSVLLYSVVLVAFLAGLPAVAAVPPVMNFQAILLDSAGNLVPDSSYEIEFGIYPDSIDLLSPEPIWDEIQTVQTNSGLFNTLLGKVNRLDATVFSGDAWLQMRLTASALPYTPRTRIGATAYTYRVQTIDMSTGGHVIGTLNPDTLQVGRSGMPGDLSVIQASGNDGLTCNPYGGYGHMLEVHDEAGNPYFRVMPDEDGTGGYLSLRRSATSTGFMVDGNKLGSQETQLRMLGSSQSLTLDMGLVGSNSVALPVDAIDATEMRDEPGVASSLSTSAVSIATTRTNLLSRTITSPADGFILAIGTVALSFSNDTNIVTIGITNDPSTWPASQEFKVSIYPLDAPGWSTEWKTVTVSAVFPVTTGSDSFYLVAKRASSALSTSAANRQLSLLYVPTNYGTVSTPSAPGADGMSDSLDSQSERLASERVNTERIAREVAAMKARLLELEQSLADQQSIAPPTQR